MTKIKDLFDFEEIKDVIDIDSDLDTTKGKKNIIQSYIISERLTPHLISLANNLSQPEHKSYQIIGGYGSGKSHLLGWIVSILENQELIQHISDKEVREKCKEKIKRKFAVVQFELQPGAPQLSDFFLDRLELQLREKYDIDIPSLDSKTPDYKRYIKKVVEVIKEKDPSMGLVVVIDEISDFLKQKRKQESERDNQFLRVLGQVSKDTDFLFVGSMQENVFTNPKYIDDAQSFGRVAGRFEQVTISQEDIKKVISQRILNKSSKQRKDIEELLEDYRKDLTDNHPLKSAPDKYIDLFPIHPYVIEVFNKLEYFEKRGAIQFVTKEVKKILDKDFPSFITFDRIYDEINSTHTIRNLDEVSPVVDVVDTLQGKIALLDEKFQQDADKLIKALAVLKLYGGTNNSGAVPEELANKLFIASKTVSSEDRVVLILDKLRQVTSGQFLSKKNKYYYLDLDSGPDLDEVIKRRAQNLPEGIEDEELLDMLGYSDLIDFEHAERYERVFIDSCPWPSKKSFRKGHFIFDDGSENVKSGDLDFNLVVLSPYQGESSIKSSTDTAILKIGYDKELDTVLKNLAATRLLIGENYKRKVMRSKNKSFRDEAKSELLEILLDSTVQIDGETKKIRTVIRQEPDSIDEFFHHLKERIFDEKFTEKYPKYPKLLNQLSHENIQGEVETAIKELVSKGKVNFVSNTENILSSLDLIDLDKNIDTSNSIFAQAAIDILEEDKGRNVKIDEITEKLSNTPLGLQKELTQLIFTVLTYNGEINLKKKGGGTITSSDLSEVFESGLDAFNVLRYATLETEFPVEDTIKLFKVFDINPGLIRNKNDRSKGVQEFRSCVLELKNKLSNLKRNIKDITSKPEPFLDEEELKDKFSELDNFPMDELLKVNTVNDFKRIKFSDKEIKKLKQQLKLIDDFHEMVEDYNESIFNDYKYMKQSIEWLKSYSNFFSDKDIEELQEIRVNCKNIMNNISELLKHEQRRLLRGKLEQYKRKYIKIYYNKHASTIGQGVDWHELEKISKSKKLKKLRNIKALKCITSYKLNRLENKILSLSKAKCEKLVEEHLKENYLCTWCSFPENLENVEDINETIENISEQIEEIHEEWKNTILKEIEEYEDNIELLSDKEKEIVEKIRAEGELPEHVGQKVIDCLNKLFSELKEAEIGSNEIEEFIFSEHNILDYDVFSEKLEEFKERILSKGDKKHIRIKRKEE